MRFVLATFWYPPIKTPSGEIFIKPKTRLCLVRHGMIKGPGDTGFVVLPKYRRGHLHYGINKPMPLSLDEARRLTEEIAVWRER